MTHEQKRREEALRLVERLREAAQAQPELSGLLIEAADRISENTKLLRSLTGTRCVECREYVDGDDLYIDRHGQPLCDSCGIKDPLGILRSEYEKYGEKALEKVTSDP